MVGNKEIKFVLEGITDYHKIYITDYFLCLHFMSIEINLNKIK